MTRREVREQLFILLFQKEFYGEAAFEEQRETYFLTQPMEAVLRLAVYEAVYDEDIPVGVAVNEAVELGKKYGEEGGASFINGILGNIVSDVPAQQGN